MTERHLTPAGQLDLNRPQLLTNAILAKAYAPSAEHAANLAGQGMRPPAGIPPSTDAQKRVHGATIHGR